MANIRLGGTLWPWVQHCSFAKAAALRCLLYLWPWHMQTTSDIIRTSHPATSVTTPVPRFLWLLTWLLALSCTLGNQSLAQSPAKRMKATVDYARFRLDTSTTLLEVYLDVEAATVSWQQTTAKDKKSKPGYQARLTLQVQVLQDGKNIAADQANISSPVLADTNWLNFPLTAMMRLSVPAKESQVIISLRDAQVAPLKGSTLLESKLDLDLTWPSKPNPQFSDVQLVRKVTPASATDLQSQYVKSGIVLEPSPSNFLSAERTSLMFYTELYDAPQLMQDSSAALSYRILKLPTFEVLGSFGATKRITLAPVLPLLREIDITELPSGHYRLQLSLLNRDGKIIGLQDKQFYRSNPTYDATRAMTEKGKTPPPASTWADTISGRHIKQYVYHAGAIASKAEYATIENLIQGTDYALMRSFYTEFWERRDKVDPYEAHWQYRRKVREAQTRFGSKSRPLLDFDRARVFLKYGEPNQVLDEMTDPARNMANTGLRYERWRYYALERFGGQAADFIFLRDEATSQYVLTHSTAPNERRNDNWQMLTRPPGIR